MTGKFINENIPAKINLPNNYEHYMVIIYKIDNYNYFCNALTLSDQFLYKYAFVNIAKEFTSHLYNCEFIDMNNDVIVSIIYHNESEINLDIIKENSKKSSRAFFENFHITVSSFISNPTDKFNHIPSLYNETCKLSLYRIIFGHNCILSTNHLNNIIIDSLTLNSEQIFAISESIKSTSIEKITLQLKDFFSYIKKCNYSNITAAISLLTAAMFNTISDIQKNSKVKFNFNYDSFSKELNYLETLMQIENKFIELANEIFDSINEYKSNKSEAIITQIKEYINSNLKDNNLSSKSLAEIVNLSPRYLSKLFYDNTFQTLQLYISEQRLEKSKELLSTTSLSMDKILYEIGWTNSKYFYTSFKKHTGVTPSEFRNNIEKNNISL